MFGICPPMDGLVDAAKCEGVKYLDPIKTADDVARMLKRDKKCDLVVCLSHLGWIVKQNVDDHKMMSGNHDIDVVLGGHSHTFFETLQYIENADGKNIPNDQNGKNAIFVGKLLLTMQR